MLKLIVFDFDDTLIHLNIKWKNLKDELIEFSKKEGLKINKKIQLIPYARAIYKIGRKKEVDKIQRKYEMKCVTKKDYAVFSDMIALVRELKNKNYKIAIVSGNLVETIETILKQINANEFFDFIVGSNTLNDIKPDPGQLNLAVKKFKVKKEETLFIGDSRYDRMAGKNAKIKTIIIKPKNKKNIRNLKRILF